jgi:hypothetical protein
MLRKGLSKQLTPELKEKVKQENLQMGMGDLHPVKLREIKIERDNLRKSGFFVPAMPVGPSSEASQLLTDLLDTPRPKSPGK